MTTKPKKTAAEVDESKAKGLPPLDLARALRRVNSGNTAWAGPYALLGQTVTYVQDDGQDTEAKVLQIAEDGSAILLVAVGTQGVDDVYQRQFGSVPLGRPGEVGTWHEVNE